MRYILVVIWLDISITSTPYLRQRAFIIHFTVLFVIAFSAFHSIWSRIFHSPPPLHTGAPFSSLAFSTHVMLPRLPVSRFSPLHFWRCRVFRSRIFSRPLNHLQPQGVPVINQPAQLVWRFRTARDLMALHWSRLKVAGCCPGMRQSSVRQLILKARL